MKVDDLFFGLQTWEAFFSLSFAKLKLKPPFENPGSATD